MLYYYRDKSPNCEVNKMTAKKELPIGIEDFKVLIDNNYYFVDKTNLLRELINNIGKVNLFTRPRRFGKTLNMSMIQRFFEKTNEDNAYLFEGLSISRDEKSMAYQGQYPVITLSLKGMKMNTFDDAIKQFGWMLSREYDRHSKLLSSDLLSEDDKAFFSKIRAWKGEIPDYCSAIQFLADKLYAFYGNKTIILIDEYDVPLENAYFRGFYDQMIGFIRSLFDNALKTNNSLEFAVLTGCLRVSKESLFTGLNNLRINGISTKGFSEYFGFTEPEVKALTEYYEADHSFSTIKEWYDGYRFGRTEIYNPWSVLNFLQDVRDDADALPTPYWSNTSSNSIIRQLISESTAETRDKIEILINGGSVKAPIHEDIVYADIDVNQESIWSFLLFTGYLKQISSRLIDDEVWLEMVIPNKEIRSIYRRDIRQWFTDKTRAVSRENLIQALVNEDVDTVNRIVGKWLKETISFYDEKEQYYHGFLAGLLAGYDAYKVKSNRETGDGRTDILLMERYDLNIAVVIEVKDVDTERSETLEKMADEALKQIEEKHYADEPIAEGYQKIIKYGAAFQGKKCLIKLGD